MELRDHYSRDKNRDRPLSFRWRARYDILREQLGELPSCKSARSEAALASILYDAIEVARAEPGRRISYSRRREWYRAADRYLGSDYGFDTVVPSVDALVEAGFLINHRKMPGGTRLGIQSSYLPSPDLAGVRLSRPEKRPAELIRLKDKAGNLIAYRDTERTSRDRKFLEKVNQTISRSEIILASPNGIQDGDIIRFGDHAVYTDMTELYRVFNGGWTLGGRMYGGWWQQVKSEDRKHFIINGCQTEEVDFEQLHPRLLYLALGKHLDGDAYTLNGWDRKLCKRAFNILLNASNYHEAKGAIAEHLGGDEQAAAALIADMKARHPEVRNQFHSGAGIRLQYLDSEIAKAVVYEMTVKNGVVVLPVHDSFIVENRYKNDLVDVMKKAFNRAVPSVGNPLIKSSTYHKIIPQMEEGSSVRGGAGAAVVEGAAVGVEAPVIGRGRRSVVVGGRDVSVPPSFLRRGSCDGGVGEAKRLARSEGLLDAGKAVKPKIKKKKSKR